MNPDSLAAPIALHYRRQFYQESTDVQQRQPGGPVGLVGREVAGRSFLEALLQHSSFSKIDVLVHESKDQTSLKETLEKHLTRSRRVRVKPLAGLDQWAGEPGARVFWEPQPIDSRWMWWRERIGKKLRRDTHVAFCGVTHTMATPAAARAIKDLVESPIRSFDALICPSSAVRHTTEAMINFYADRSRIGVHGDRPFPHLETIPLGVDCQRHRPATLSQRNEMRRQLGIPAESSVVLFVGRLSHHAKANPLPLMGACQTVATRRAGRIDLVFAGWFANDSVRRAYIAEAARIAPDVHCHFVDGRNPKFRDSVWHAADVFSSLADSVQETFGLTVSEAISRGLPVIASDWNGYRDIVSHGENGFLVPTTMMPDICEDAWFAMHERSISYDGFLASVSQSVAVDQPSLVNHLQTLLADNALRDRLGAAGRRRAMEQFSWPAIMSRYEDLWHRQREWSLAARTTQIASTVTTSGPTSAPVPRTIAPSLRTTFGLYPTRWLDESLKIKSTDSSVERMTVLHQSSLARHGHDERLSKDETTSLLQFIVDAGATKIASLIANSEIWLSNLPDAAKRDSILATVAWCLKYDLLRLNEDELRLPAHVSRTLADTEASRLDLTYALTCMGRLDHLKQTLPSLVANGRGRIVVIDYDCPDRCGDWIDANFQRSDVKAVRVVGKTLFDRSDAKNHAIDATETDWVCLMDADIVVGKGFADAIEPRLQPGVFLRSDTIREGTGGTFIARKFDLESVGRHDPTYQGWGEEDDDLIEALLFAGIKSHPYPGKLIQHIDHSDERRTQFHDETDRRLTHMINRLYRAAKWDLARVSRSVPTLDQRKTLFEQVSDQVRLIVESQCKADIVIPAGTMNWVPLAAHCERQLRYQVQPESSAAPGKYATSDPVS